MYLMLKRLKNRKNSLNCNDLVLKGMFKRRKLANSAISQICTVKKAIRLVK